MSTSQRLLEDISAVYARSNAFVGDFLYGPLGIETSEFVNSVTLIAMLGVIVLGLYRITQPAPRPRRGSKEYGFGRNV